jgi:hypothetical protein
MQVVAVKPIARWQIWLGKWLGIITLDTALLALAGACIFGLLHWRAGKLPASEQRILREEVLVARASLKENPPDIDAEVERIFRERTRNIAVDPQNAAVVKEQLREALKVDVVPPNNLRRWTIDLGARRAWLKAEPLFMRFKFHAANTNALGTYRLRIEAGEPETPRRQAVVATFGDNAFHEVRVEPNLWNASGVLTVDIQNRSDTTLVFPIDEGFELLYRESSFPVNFARGLLIVLFWLALLATIGLTAASFLSFPVAAFVSASVLVLGLSTGTLSAAVEAGTIMGVNEETGEVGKSLLDVVLIPLFKSMLGIFKLVQGFSPVEALSTGRSVGWGTLAQAFTQIVLVLGGLIGSFGVWMFHRRELAAANTQ